MSVTTTHWETLLFSDPARTTPPRPADRLSPRAAYQEVLHGRATLVDIRPPGARLTEGAIAPWLAVEVVDLTLDLDEPGLAARPWTGRGTAVGGRRTRLVLLCGDGHRSATAAEALARLGEPSATHLTGGFRAWREAGLPTVP